MKIRVRGPLTTQTDFGYTTLGLVKALAQMGAEVSLEPTLIDSSPPRFVEVLLDNDYSTPPYDLTISHDDPHSLRPSDHASTSDFNMAWTGTRTPSLSLPDFASRYSAFDAVVAYDQHTLRTLDTAFERSDLSTRSLLVQSPGFDRDFFRLSPRDYSTLRFLVMGSFTTWSANVMALRSFVRLKEEGLLSDTELYVYARSDDPHTDLALLDRISSWHPDIRVTIARYSLSELNRLYRSCHILFALSNDPNPVSTYQFAATGGAIAMVPDRLSTSTSWLSDLYAFPIRPDTSNSAKYPGVSPSVDHLESLMIAFHENPRQLRDKGEQASYHVPSMLSWEDTLDRLFLRLSDGILNGHEVRMKALLCHADDSRDGYR